MERGIYDAAWLKQVPLKVSIFVCQLLCNRLPTKDNLCRMQALLHDDIYCIGGCSSMESICHILIRCDIFGSVWYRIYRWLGIYFISQTLSVIIFSSLVTWRGYRDLHILFSRWSGTLAFGSFGRKEITGSSKTKHKTWNNYLTM